MSVTYIIESRYCNGDKYAERVENLVEVGNILNEIGRLYVEAINDDERIDVNQISVTTEEE